MLRDQQLVRRDPPARDRVPHLIQQALEAWRQGTAVSVRQGLFTTMHHAGCLDEWNYLCQCLTDWGLYGLGTLVQHVRAAHMPPECRVEA